jgi:lipopolysaccharide transport system ATP-binding protein
MAEPVIRVRGVSKKYRIGQRERKADTMMATLLNGIKSPLTNLRRIRNLAKLNDHDDSVFWALKDISFDVLEGEVLGIIGHNGAGKSTLLKILSRITEPSQGEIQIHGRIAALLEVGTGFHPELTGRENIYMNGTILGMRKKEIDKKLDEIVDFSGVEKHLDTPVKFYSSGMRVRLGFSVAAHLEPEILIIDEVLSVGDAEFQRKCLGKMESVAGQGRTVLFVSHNLVAVSSLCGKGLLLKGGRLIAEGPTPEVIGIYQKTSDVSLEKSRRWNLEDAPGNELIKITQVSALPLGGSTINIDSGVRIQYLFYCAVENKNLDTTLEVITKDEIVVFHKGVVLGSERNGPGFYSISVEIPPFLLNANVYRIKLIFGESQRYLLFQTDHILAFEIENSNTGMGSNLSRVPGVIRPELEWKIEFNENRS